MKKGMKMNNKAMTFLEIIVYLVLLLIVAFLVIMALTGNFSIFTDFFKNTGSDNLGNVVQGCNLACDTNSLTDYCIKPRTVVFDETGKKNPRNNQKYNCFQLRTENVPGLRESNLCPDCSGITTQYYKCVDLAQTNCAGLAGCHVESVTPDQVKSYQDQVGPLPLKYKEVKPLPVTDPIELRDNKVCLKLVDN